MDTDSLQQTILIYISLLIPMIPTHIVYPFGRERVHYIASKCVERSLQQDLCGCWGSTHKMLKREKSNRG